MNAFAAAVNAIFSDPNMAADGLLLPETPVRIVRRVQDDVTGFGGAQLVTPGFVFEMRVSEAPLIDRGDLVQLGGELFRLSATPRADADRLVWTCEVTPA